MVAEYEHAVYYGEKFQFIDTLINVSSRLGQKLKTTKWFASSSGNRRALERGGKSLLIMKIEDKNSDVATKLPNGVRSPLGGKMKPAKKPVKIYEMYHGMDLLGSGTLKELGASQNIPMSKIYGMPKVETPSDRERNYLIEVGQRIASKPQVIEVDQHTEEQLNKFRKRYILRYEYYDDDRKLVRRYLFNAYGKNVFKFIKNKENAAVFYDARNAQAVADRLKTSTMKLKVEVL
ncbi:hypothetical protein [Periweissella cryptocerci]|uniref:hypothetical protein n=1 Tax=Periweissella cryptocerci TaxID=2506420 RepID=UPI001FA9F486|nr:hypothetical protein [Periweissella cryptocerci]